MSGVFCCEAAFMLHACYIGQDVRTVVVDGEPWFVLADVSRVLGLTNPSMVASRLDEDQKGLSQADTLGGSQRLVTVTVETTLRWAITPVEAAAILDASQSYLESTISRIGAARSSLQRDHLQLDHRPSRGARP